MDGNVRQAVGRLLDGNPAARLEAALAVLRVCVLALSAMTLLVTPLPTSAPLVVNSALAVLAVGMAFLVTLVRTPTAALRLGLWTTVCDVVAFAAYSLAFHDVQGAGTLFGVWVLVAGPVRYGLKGVPLSVLPVAVTASFWPQLDTEGHAVSAAQAWLLCGLFTVPAIVVRALWLRGSKRIREAEHQFATAFEHASIGMALVDERDGILQANRSLALLLGTETTELEGQRVPDLADLLDQQVLRTALASLDLEAPTTRLEVRLRRQDGGLRWGNVSASLLSSRPGEPRRMVVQIENVTERRRSQAMLSHAAAHDALTDLPNRTLLLSRLDGALADGEQVGVLFVDLDRFKVVNDSLGHAAGDLLLVQVAVRLKEAMRHEDLVARIGGDEFVVLVRRADVALCQAISDRVLAALREPVRLPTDGELSVGASVGIALGRVGDTAETVLRDADTAMYAAKTRGGGRHHLFTSELREAVVRAHELEVDLRAAVRAGEIGVAYQPLYDVRTGMLTGVEALARWEHPRRGTVPAEEFIAVAELSDLIVELGESVLAQALADARRWPATEGRPPVVSVNVSLRQLISPDFVATVGRHLATAQLGADRLCLEVTETVLVGDVDAVIVTLTALRDLGVHLSIDDFGTGHASLTYLARFPVDQVKIDRSFILGLGQDAGSAAIVGGVIAMAHTFDMRVVAEGVETDTQLSSLRDLGCDAVQGFMLARPCTDEQLRFLLRRRSVGSLVPAPRRSERLVVGDSDTELARHRLLIDGALRLTGSLDVEAVLERALDALGAVVRLTGGSLLLVEDGQVRIAAARPLPTEDALVARIPVGQGVAGGIAATGDPRYLPDITIASTVSARRRSASTSTGVRSWFGVPLVADGHVSAILQIDSTEVDAFDERDRFAVVAFAPVVTLALQGARRAAADLRDLQDGGARS